jgi:hypothetical protein
VSVFLVLRRKWLGPLFPGSEMGYDYTAFLRWFLPHIQLLHVSPHLLHIACKVRIVASMTELSFFHMRNLAS